MSQKHILHFFLNYIIQLSFCESLQFGEAHLLGKDNFQLFQNSPNGREDCQEEKQKYTRTSLNYKSDLCSHLNIPSQL